MNQRLTLREAARALGVSLSTVRRKVQAGELKAVLVEGPFGPRWEVDLERVKPLSWSPWSG